MRNILLCCLFLLWVPSALAHRDTLIKLKGTRLEGLPKEYEPAEFDAAAGKLRIGKKELVFDRWTSTFFEQKHELTLGASWYHESSTPPYLSFMIQPEGRDYSYTITVDLDKLEIMSVSAVLKTGEGSRYLDVVLPKDR